MKKIILIHKIVGIISIVGFAISGMYMRFNVANIDLNDEKLHILFRANHIYILFISIINLLIGFMYHTTKNRFIFYVASIFIIASTIGLQVAFYIEPINNSLDRPVTANSLYMMLAGSVLFLINLTTSNKISK